MSRIVPDDRVEHALSWLRDSAHDLGEAKAECVRASHMIKVVKALEMKKHNQLSAAKAEVEALASKAYLDALLEDAKAAGKYEQLRALREAAAATIESWRTESSNFRAMKL